MHCCCDEHNPKGFVCPLCSMHGNYMRLKGDPKHEEKKPLSWNHRVIRTEAGLGEYAFNIHEVYYDADGVPVAQTVNPVAPFGETLDELRADIANFAAAIPKPVLVRADTEAFGFKLVELAG